MLNCMVVARCNRRLRHFGSGGETREIRLTLITKTYLRGPWFRRSASENGGAFRVELELIARWWTAQHAVGAAATSEGGGGNRPSAPPALTPSHTIAAWLTSSLRRRRQKLLLGVGSEGDRIRAVVRAVAIAKARHRLHEFRG